MNLVKRISNLGMSVKNLMVFMNVFYVRVVQHHVQAIGGTVTNILVQRFYFNLIGGYKTVGTKSVKKD